MFQAGTGWLGWTPELVLNTPIPQLELAIDGLVKWTKITNPWGSKDEDSEPDEKETTSTGVADKLKMYFGSRVKRE